MKPVLFIPSVLIVVVSGFSATPKHWHETNGFGTDIKGGIAGEVYKVTNLNSSGSGSLKDAVSKGDRLVVFEVGGVINGGFSIADNVTIAGQTAPYPGITIIKGGMTVNGSNIVVSHITTCLGTDVGGYPDAGNIGGNNIVYDHVAVYWGMDETLSLAGTRDVTLYKCIIAEGLQFTGHIDGEHSKGLHIQSGNDQLSVIGCLCANNAIRNPRIDRSTAFLANHVVYNFAPAWDHIGAKLSSEDEIPNCAHCLNKVVSAYDGTNTLVESVALQGPESKAEFFLDGHNVSTAGYIKGNIIKDRQGNDLKQANTEGVTIGGRESIVTLLNDPPIWPEGMEPLPAEEALYEVLRTVGPHPGKRNPQNARVVKTVADDTGVIIDSQDEVGGYPDYPATSRKLDNIPDGAEARQKWLDELEDEIAVDREINLSRLYSMVGSKASDKLKDTVVAIPKSEAYRTIIVQGQSVREQLHISITLAATSAVSLSVFDLAGNLVLQELGKNLQAGSHFLAVNVAHLSAGLYLCRFKIGDTTRVRLYHRF